MITRTITQVVGEQQPKAATETVTCDEPTCTHTVTFDALGADKKKLLEENPWLKTIRTTNRSDGKSFMYCSDECELKGIASGNHNSPEPKKIQSGENLSMQQVEAMAKQAAQVDKAIRTGGDATIQVAQG